MTLRRNDKTYRRGMGKIVFRYRGVGKIGQGKIGQALEILATKIWHIFSLEKLAKKKIVEQLEKYKVSRRE